MADVNINQPGPVRESSGSTGVVLAVVVVVALILVAWLLLGGGVAGDRNHVEVNVPEARAPEVDVPDRVEVQVPEKVQVEVKQ